MGEKRRRASSGGLGPFVARLFWLGVIAWAVMAVATHFRLDEILRRWGGGGRSIDGVSVLGRETWKAAPPRGQMARLSSPRRITIHHMGGRVVGEYGRDETARIIKAIQRNHQDQRAWCDIAYHFVVDRSGRVWEGRPLSRTGAHAGSADANRGNIGVLVLGNFDQQVPSGAQVAGLRRLLEALCRSEGIPRSCVCGHDEVRSGSGLGHTSCPGRYLARWVDEFRSS